MADFLFLSAPRSFPVHLVRVPGRPEVVHAGGAEQHPTAVIGL